MKIRCMYYVVPTYLFVSIIVSNFLYTKYGQKAMRTSRHTYYIIYITAYCVERQRRVT